MDDNRGVTSSEYLNRVMAAAADVNPAEVEALVEAIAAAHRDGRFVFIVGNGGSGANASHLCEDLGKGTLTDFDGQRRLKVLSLTDNTSYILAWGNDTSFDRVFVEQLRNLGGAGDLLIAISGSGNSPNVLRTVEFANAAGMHTFSVTGYDGGALKKMAHAGLHVPSMNMGIVEAVHGIYFHYLVDALRERLR